MMVLFTSLVFLRQCRVKLRLGIPLGLDRCRFSDSIVEGPTVKAAARYLVRSRLVATEPQWPRMNSTFSRSLRTCHSTVIPKISLRALRLLSFRPSSLPRFAASDDGRFAPSELPARPIGLSCSSRNHCRGARQLLQTKEKAVGSNGGAELFQWNNDASPQ